MSSGRTVGFGRHRNDLYLWGVKSLAPAAAIGLARHRGDLFLDGLARLPARIAAAILTSRDDATISLKGLRNLSTAALAKLRGHPGIELPKHLRDPAGPTAPDPAAAGARPGGKGGLIRAIQRIAHQGEAMLQG